MHGLVSPSIVRATQRNLFALCGPAEKFCYKSATIVVESLRKDLNTFTIYSLRKLLTGFINAARMA